jgi:hypothetical protein
MTGLSLCPINIDVAQLHLFFQEYSATNKKSQLKLAF